MDEPEELTFDEIFNQLIANDDIILDQVDEDDIPRIRKGLSNYKSKLNQRLTKQELPTEERMLDFETLEVYNNGTIKLRIFFLQPKGIRAKLIPSDGSLS